MKKFISLIVIVFFLRPCVIYAKVNLINLSCEVISIGAFYFSDFKQIRGKLKSEDGGNNIYWSKAKLTASVDTSKLIYHNKVTGLWALRGQMNKELIRADEMELIAWQLLFSFGQLKAIVSGVEWVSLFVPVKKKGHEKIKLFHFSIYNSEENPNNQYTPKLSTQLGKSNLYTSK